MSDSARLYPGCYLPPPPPPDVDGAPEKKSVGVPPLISLFWDLREFRGWRSEKNTMLCPPFLKFLDPPLLSPNI